MTGSRPCASISAGSVAGFACLLVVAVVQGFVPPVVAVAMVVGNAAITAAVLSVTDRIAMSMLVAVALIHLTLAVRPPPIDPGPARPA